ncbi:MAG: radical SAM protein [Acetobacteraceae bacterium]|nr:radical SAM protein [Acetobacteraceae bacterium]
MIRVSLGTAAVLGLSPARVDAPPRTAYILCGQGCALDCGFCPQARSSRSPRGLLSRVTWPEARLEEVVPRLAEAASRGLVGRACLQVVEGEEGRSEARRALSALSEAARLPVSVSAAFAGPQPAKEWIRLGAERVGIPLDGASPAAFRLARGGDFCRALARVEAAARACPGRVSTHLIVGLGETDEELVRLLARLTAQGIAVGLFAFTPVRGTRLERLPPPPLKRYRRLQAAHHLLRLVPQALSGLRFDGRGRLVGWGLSRKELEALLSPGDAFLTAGCPDCNRPYYNERPQGPIYNYPRPLSPREAAAAVALALAPAAGDGAGEEALEGAGDGGGEGAGGGAEPDGAGDECRPEEAAGGGS